MTVFFLLTVNYSQTPCISSTALQPGPPLHHSSGSSLYLDRGGYCGTGNGISGTRYQDCMRLLERIVPSSQSIPRSFESLLVSLVLLQYLVGHLVLISVAAFQCSLAFDIIQRNSSLAYSGLLSDNTAHCCHALLQPHSHVSGPDCSLLDNNAKRQDNQQVPC